MSVKFPLLDAQGEPYAIAGISTDITERKQAQVAIERYKLLAQQARDILLFIRLDGQIVEANQAAVDAYGYDYATLLTKRIHDLRDPATLAELAMQLQQANSAGMLYETRHRRADGNLFPAEVSASGADIGGERLILSIIRDNTARKRAEQQIHFQAGLIGRGRAGSDRQ